MDGVGKDPSTGKSYYFVSMAKGGAFAETINVPSARLLELSPTASPIQVAALMNPGMSSWMALKARAKDIDLSRGFTCVILGATTQSGKVAIEFARHLGSTKVIGVARDAEKLSTLKLDESIILKENPADSEWEKMGDAVDIILDYLWGPAFVACLTNLNSKLPTQAVQIGSMAGLETQLPSALLRSKDITLRGSGPGSWKMELFAKEAEGMLRAVEGLSVQDVKVRGLLDVGDARGDEKTRTVFVP
jgi:NADPH:quinone reductase-like Zn-dependent oxidoreductase